jgi:hypothetical protein
MLREVTIKPSGMVCWFSITAVAEKGASGIDGTEMVLMRMDGLR